jgi:hypothetical protein
MLKYVVPIILLVVATNLFSFSDNINLKDLQETDSKYSRFLFGLGGGASKIFDDYASIGFGAQSSTLFRIYNGNALGLSLDYGSWKYSYPSVFAAMDASTIVSGRVN